MAMILHDEIINFLRRYPEGKVTVQGEFTLCMFIFAYLPTRIFIFPTTERVVEEKVKEDGTVEKVQRFRFVRWR